jgi:hypothetical protein
MNSPSQAGFYTYLQKNISAEGEWISVTFVLYLKIKNKLTVYEI